VKSTSSYTYHLTTVEIDLKLAIRAEVNYSAWPTELLLEIVESLKLSFSGVVDFYLVHCSLSGAPYGRFEVFYKRSFAL